MAISLAEWRTIGDDLVAGDPPVHYGGALVCPCGLQGHLLWHRWMVICLVGYNRLRGTFHLSPRECCQAAPGWQTGHPSLPHAELSEHVIDITLKLELGCAWRSEWEVWNRRGCWWYIWELGRCCWRGWRRALLPISEAAFAFPFPWAGFYAFFDFDIKDGIRIFHQLTVPCFISRRSLSCLSLVASVVP